MKQTVKTMIASLITLCVVMGHGGLLLAVESAPLPAVCDKCPCETEKPSCCVDRPDAGDSKDLPAIPAAEQRVVHPVAFDVVGIGVLPTPPKVQVASGSIFDFRSAVSSVPLFLRHRAILI